MGEMVKCKQLGRCNVDFLDQQYVGLCRGNKVLMYISDIYLFNIFLSRCDPYQNMSVRKSLTILDFVGQSEGVALEKTSW